MTRTASIEIPLVLQIKSQILHKTQVVKHYKGQRYEIVLTPHEDYCQLEASNTPAYGYRKAGEPASPSNPLWFRTKSEMEDPARFQPEPLVVPL